ncbi:hypothetical protein R1flu_019363 [Riccia fluitans]|uniref:Lachrymatory factor synthase n=1 Tax=Riccia fluitans TaxID=41844 RepID=A0ABD1ZIS4_9MARC
MANAEEVPKTTGDKGEELSSKWHGELKMVINCSIEKAWELTSDFCGMQRWVDTTESCECVEGEPQKPGCVRFLYGGSFPRADGGKSWAREKLLALDDENRTLSYAMLENNFGLSGYRATYRLHDQGDGAVLVDWSFEVDPIAGSTEQKTADYMTGVFRSVLKKLEALVNSNSELERSRNNTSSESGRAIGNASDSSNLSDLSSTPICL